MAKAKRMYGCTECGSTFPKWAGQCGDCGAWNTLVETVVEATPAASGRAGWAGDRANIKTLAEVSVEEVPRFSTASGELDRVLGGGLVDGSVVLIGGDRASASPRSSCRRSALSLSASQRCMSPARNRSNRLPCAPAAGPAAGPAQGDDRDLHRIDHRHRPRRSPRSWSSTRSDHLYRAAAVGTAAWPVRESAALLVRFAKQSGTAIFLVGHVTRKAPWPGRACFRAYGRHGALFRGRVRWPSAPAAGGEEPLRRGQRAGRVRHDRQGPQGGHQPLGDLSHPCSGGGAR